MTGKFHFIIFLLLVSFCSANAQDVMPQHHLLQRIAQGKRIAAAERSHRDADNGRGTMRRVKAYGAASLQLPDSVGPLLTDSWDQYAPFYNMTPTIDGEHCVVGCIATAMTQVMHYWKYPERGLGSHTYEDSVGCKQTLTADFASHRYDWGNMLDDYVEGEYSQQEADAVALLSSDCGISVNMKYGVGTSGAQAVNQANAMVEHFGYDRGTQLYFRDFYSTVEIEEKIKAELAAQRPVLISGYNANGGHAFVIDGYNGKGEFHVCIGNPDPNDNNWTTLRDMVPNQPEWCDNGSGENGLNVLECFTMGVCPDGDGAVEHQYAMRDVVAADSLPVYDRDETFGICVRELCNVGRSLHGDSVAVMLMRDDEVVCPLYVYDRTFLLEEVDDTTYTDTLWMDIPRTVPAGEYLIQPMFRDNGVWQYVRTCTGTPNYLCALVGDESVELRSDTACMAYLTLEDIDIPDMIVNGTAPDLSITLKAHRGELSGRFYFRMEPDEDRTVAFTMLQQGITLNEGEVVRCRFHKTKIYAPKTGKYRLHIYYNSNLLSDEMVELTDEEGMEVTMLRSGAIQLAER